MKQVIDNRGRKIEVAETTPTKVEDGVRRLLTPEELKDYNARAAEHKKNEVKIIKEEKNFHLNLLIKEKFDKAKCITDALRIICDQIALIGGDSLTDEFKELHSFTSDLHGKTQALKDHMDNCSKEELCCTDIHDSKHWT